MERPAGSLALVRDSPWGSEETAECLPPRPPRSLIPEPGPFQIFGWKCLRRRELVTTDTELNAMAADANMGLRRIPQKG